MGPTASLLILAFGVLVMVNSAPVNDKLPKLGRIMSVTHRVRRDSTPPPPRPCVNATPTTRANVGAVVKKKIKIFKKKIIGQILSVAKRVRREEPTVPNPRPC